MVAQRAVGCVWSTVAFNKAASDQALRQSGWALPQHSTWRMLFGDVARDVAAVPYMFWPSPPDDPLKVRDVAAAPYMFWPSPPDDSLKVRDVAAAPYMFWPSPPDDPLKARDVAAAPVMMEGGPHSYNNPLPSVCYCATAAAFCER
eukprot:6279159-Pyramimonas_sp.AAC.1